MRRVLLSSLALGVLAGAACAIQALPRPPRPASASVSASATLNPARAADRRLLAYGEAHPECRMWTNWEKLCSRAGPGGSVQCTVDPDRRVTPATPFCAAGGNAPPSPRPRSEQASAERFCRRHASARSSNSAGRGAPTRLCAQQEPERPFNGRRIAALMQPGCEGLADAETGRPFCRRGGDAAAGIPDCGVLAAQGYEHSRWLQCSRWSGESSCRAYPIMREQLSGSATAFGALDPNFAPVHGLFCENR
jgi:hypothetical protein